MSLAAIARRSGTAQAVGLGPILGPSEKASDLVPACPSRQASDRKDWQPQDNTDFPNRMCSSGTQTETVVVVVEVVLVVLVLVVAVVL